MMFRLSHFIIRPCDILDIDSHMSPKPSKIQRFPSTTQTLDDIGRLLISCPDRPGIVAAVSQYLFNRGANIIHSDQHSTDAIGGTFFMRIEFNLSGLSRRRDEIENGFSEIANSFSMEWQMSYAEDLHRLAIFVSKADHVLFELLWRLRAGDIRAEAAMVISNHPDLEEMVTGWGVPFHYIPVNRDEKEVAENAQIKCMVGKVDTIVFARYMQIVTPRLISHYPNRIINIHHSFLPAFTGAEPYSQAHQRGVKLVGATAHYVTGILDSGPIIDQDVQRVDHRHSIQDLKRIGKTIERTVLARAVSWHVDDRIIAHENKTVVFG